MPHVSPDERSTERRERDDAIAAEPALAPLDLPSNEPAVPLESHLRPVGRPLAMPGVVENGLIRVLDPSVSLPEHSRVIIVASQNS